MNDQELSSLLQEWKRTPAPPTLDARVFGSRQVIAPRWWDRVPASITALSGVAVGGLMVFTLTTLLPPRPSQPASPPVTQPSPSPSVPEAPLPTPTAPAPVAVPKPRPRPAKTGPFVTTPPVEVRPSTKGFAAPRVLSATGSAPAPVYAPTAILPPGAQGLTTTTKVKLRIKIDKDGHVTEATVIDGDPVLNDAAIETVLNWTFERYLLNGAAAERTSEVTVNFTSRAPKAAVKN